MKCGEVSYAQGSVIGGTKTTRGQWPFLVALYHLEHEIFFCGGNLFTSKHVLTGGLPFIDNYVSTILISIQPLTACTTKISVGDCKPMNLLFYLVVSTSHVALNHTRSKEMSVKFISIQIGDIWMRRWTLILRFSS